NQTGKFWNLKPTRRVPIQRLNHIQVVGGEEQAVQNRRHATDDDEVHCARVEHVHRLGKVGLRRHAWSKPLPFSQTARRATPRDSFALSKWTSPTWLSAN